MTTAPGLLRSPLAEGDPHVDAVVAPRVSLRNQVGHFALHYLEMCLPMCIGFAVGDLVYFWVAGLFGYAEPFGELPVLSVLVVTFSMTAPMTAWMLFRGMPRRAIIEMSAAMPALAIVFLAFGWLGLLPMGDLALLEHGLMMPVMLVPMFLRLDLYTGRAGNVTSSALRRDDEAHGTAS
jgi:small-conductance mechanosensitive channel